jgi:hypothetical protein
VLTHALTLLGNEPRVPPAVKTAVAPPALATTVPGGLGTVHTGVSVVMILPCASLTVAVNVCVPPGNNVVVCGVTAIDAAAPTVTVAVAVAVTPLHVTVIVDVPGVLPAVKSPACVIVPPPLATAQVGADVMVLPLLSFVTAVNC